MLSIEKLIQSPFLHLQAAGSDFSDFSSRGAHLRWQLKGRLGDEHLPKGNLAAPQGPYATQIGFNRPEDFVYLYKAYYKTEYAIDLQFTKPPTSVVETGTQRKWLYMQQAVTNLSNTFSDIEVRFTDIALYDSARALHSPLTNPAGFLQVYKGVIEVQVIGQLLFKACFLARPLESIDCTLDVETITVPDLTQTQQRYISCRETKFVDTKPGGTGNDKLCFTCENMEYIRFKCNAGYVAAIRLITYTNTWLGYNDQWKFVDKFSLTEDLKEIRVRLDNPIGIDNQVDHQWPKYNDVNIGSGAFTVSVDNYINRWEPTINPTDGIKYAVQHYLQLSQADLLAQSSAPSSNTGDMAVNEFSYLQVLNILASDYHIARMLGLGHIDQQQKEEQDFPYIYYVAYQTNTDLGVGFPAKQRVHISMSLPTKQTDYRYPPRPALKQITYGFISSITGTPSNLTNAAGYTSDGLSRFVNINMMPFSHQRPFETFFANRESFCLCAQSLPVLYGLEYKHDSEPNYRAPELLNDSNYFDSSGLPETIAIPDQNQPNKPIYTHRETEEGKHHYALYSINIFSRVSTISNNVATDVTLFSRKPLPPINLMSQLIQQENQLIFTTSTEQALLSSIGGADKSLARVTFEWNQAHNDAYQFADEVEFLIRKQAALMVRGKVTNVQAMSNNRALVSTGSFLISSSNPSQTIQPNIPPALAASFVGGIIAVGSYLFEIESINSTGNNPSFVVKKILERTSVEDPNDPGSYLMSETYRSPANNEYFTANQNLSLVSLWDGILDKKVKLEKFFQLQVSNSSHAANNKLYTILKVEKVGANTEITTKEPIPNTGAAGPGKINYKKYIKYYQSLHAQNSILLKETLTGELAVGDTIELIAAGGNTSTYTIANVYFGNHFCRIEFNQPLTDTTVQAGVLVLDKQKNITLLGTNKLTIGLQNLVKELIPAHREFHLIDEGENVHEFVIGGINDVASIISIPDPSTGQASGAFEVTLTNFVLTPPLDTNVNWHKGSIRIQEDAAYFPPVGSVNYRSPEVKVLQIWSIDLTGAQTKLVVYDTSFVLGSAMSNPLSDYMPIEMGVNVTVNVHPGYRVYLTKTNANASGINPFKSSDLLPAIGQGTRQTLLSARSKDTLASKFSGISTPTILLAQEIIIPEPPGIPAGPVFATRPDVYGKSTYTFDLTLNTTGGRLPYAIIAYRVDTRKLLSALYLPTTVNTIIAALDALPNADKAFFNTRFTDLANVNYDTTTNQFRAYVLGGYRFPVPDNTDYVIPNPNTAIVQKPFNGVRFFGQNFTVTLYNNSNGSPVTQVRSMQQIIKDALDGAYLPLTEQPMLYRYIKDGRITSPAKPKVRNSNGEIIVPSSVIDFNVFDPFPMAVKYTDGAQSKVRFTDYTLDGAANAWYFYYAVEMNNKFEVSDRGPVAGPISLVNTMPAEPPAIKTVISTPANTLLRKGPLVQFKMNEFIPSEKIKKLRIYRATNHRDAVAVRNMTLAKELSVTDVLVDDFSDLSDLPFTEPLFYRVVALREITNEQGLTEYVPSKPSEISLTNIIDQVNPQAPTLTFTSNPYLPVDLQMNNISLSWEKTTHNGKYVVYKLSSAGNWVSIYEIKTNTPTIQVALSATNLASGSLVKLVNGEKRFHQFKVVAVNSSNLMSLEDKVLVI